MDFTVLIILELIERLRWMNKKLKVEEGKDLIRLTSVFGNWKVVVHSSLQFQFIIRFTWISYSFFFLKWTSIHSTHQCLLCHHNSLILGSFLRDNHFRGTSSTSWLSVSSEPSRTGVEEFVSQTTLHTPYGYTHVLGSGSTENWY